MGYRYDGMHGLWVRHSGSWVFQGTVKDLEVMHGGFWNKWWKGSTFHAIGAGGTWTQRLHTDKYAPNAGPATATISSLAGGGGTRKAHVSWTEAGSIPNPALSYDLYINFTNNTNPALNSQQMIAAGRPPGGGSVDFVNNALGDSVTADLSYQETGTGGFSGPVTNTGTITL
jgi:hypothetical protein